MTPVMGWDKDGLSFGYGGHMATKLYTLYIPVRLAVEASNIGEARNIMRQLWWEVMEGLPVGAGAFEKEDAMRRYIDSNTVRG